MKKHCPEIVLADDPAACRAGRILDPEFNPYHRQVLEFIALRTRYMLASTTGNRWPFDGMARAALSPSTLDSSLHRAAH